MSVICLLGQAVSPVAAQEALAQAEDAAHGTSDVRHIYVPANEPQVWPSGDWRPVTEAAYRELRREHGIDASPPPQAFLEHVVYRARYSEQSLRGGTLEGVARLRSDQPRFMTLGSPSLALHDLRWPEGDALWGSAPRGQALLRVEGDRQRLTGRWSLAGRAVFDNVEFDISIPPAVISQLEIEVPSSSRVLLNAGLVSRVSPSDNVGWMIWSIDLGHRTSCRMTVTPRRESPSPPEGDILASKVVQYSLRLDGMHLQSDVTIERATGPVAWLDFHVPAGMRFSAVTTGGDVVLPSQRRKVGSEDRLRIDVRGLGLSQGTTIRLRGRMRLRRGEAQELPRLNLHGAQWMRIRRSVAVARPLELRDIHTEGCQLIGSSINDDAGDSLDYEVYAPNSRIALTVDVPAPTITSTVISHVTWQANDPLMRSTLLLRALSGSTFVVECLVPAEWEITKLESDAATPVAQWSRAPGSETGDGDFSRLSIEFRKALSPQVTAEVTVWCRQATSVISPLVNVPVVLPLVSGHREVCVVIEPLADVHFNVESDSAYERVSLESLMEEWGGLLPDDLSRFEEQRLLVLRADDPPAGERLDVDPHRAMASKAPHPSAGDPLVEKGRAAWPSLSASGPDPTDARADTGGPLSAPLTLETTAAIDRGRLCRNRGIFDLPETSVPRQLTFRLAHPARLITVQQSESSTSTDLFGEMLRIDGQRVLLTLPPSNERRQLEILYESPLRQSVISGSAEIPLPEWNGHTSTISWEIRLPNEYRLGSPTDGTSARPLWDVSWSQRLFGPLGRSSNGRLFWPFSADSWQSLITTRTPPTGPNHVAADLPPGGVIRRSLPGANTVLRLSLWNVGRAEQVGWVALAFGLFLAAWPFQHQRLLSPRWSLGIALFGVVATCLAPQPLVIPCGGFVTGTIFGSLLPNEWRIRTSRTAHRAPRSSPSATQFVTRMQATGVCLLIWLAWGSHRLPAWQSTSSSAGARKDSLPSPLERKTSQRLDVLIPLESEHAGGDRLPPIVYLEQSQLQAWSGRRAEARPDFLIRSAEYEVTGFETSDLRVVSRFNVALLPPHYVRHVTLPITGATFANADACRVNGRPAALLPHRSGRGVVVDVGSILNTPQREPPEDDHSQDLTDLSDVVPRPQFVQIELECRPRPSKTTLGPRLDLGIPAVLDSEAVFRVGGPESPPIEVAHRGASRPPRADGLWPVSLGRVTQLAAHPARAHLGRRWLEPRSVVSLIETHLLRHQVTSRLSFTVAQEALPLSSRSLELSLPSGSIVREIRAGGLERSQTNSDATGHVQLHLTFQDVPATELAIELDFEVPVSSRQDTGGVTLPELSFLTDAQATPFPVHHLGISASPGFAIAAADSTVSSADVTAPLPELMAEWLAARRIRSPDVVHRLEAPRPIEIPLSSIEPDADVTSSQTLTILESRIDWTATLDVTVRDAAVAAHRIGLDSRLRIQQITVRQDGVERFANWSQQDPRELTLFLPEEFTGNQTLEFHGTVVPTDLQDFAVPSIVLHGASLVSSPSVLVQYANDLPVEVRRGTDVLPSPMTSPMSAGGGPLSEMGPFFLEDTNKPIRMRIAESKRQWSLNQLTVIRSSEDDWIEQMSTLRVTAIEPASGAVVVYGSGLPNDFEITSSLTVSKQVRESTGDIAVHLELPHPPPSRWTLSVHCRRDADSAASWTLPLFAVSGSTIGRHFVVASPDAAIEFPRQGQRLSSPMDLPEWVAELAPDTVANWLAWEIGADEMPIPVTHIGDVAASIRRLDSAIWQLADGSWYGVTVADVIAHRHTSVSIVIPSGLSLVSATQSGSDNVDISQREVEFHLTKQAPPARCTLWWRLAQSPGSGGEIPLPRPATIDGQHTNVVVLGQTEQYYYFNSDAVVEQSTRLLQDLAVADELAGVGSPIAHALRAAGVNSWIDRATVAATSVNPSGLMSLRLPAAATGLRGYHFDRQIVRMTVLVFVSLVLVIGWLMLGRWIDLRRFQQRRVVPSSCGLLSIATLIWLWGASFAGLLMMLVATRRCLQDIRRS